MTVRVGCDKSSAGIACGQFLRIDTLARVVCQLGQTVTAMFGSPVGMYGSGFVPFANRSAIQWIMSAADGPMTPAWL